MNKRPALKLIVYSNSRWDAMGSLKTTRTTRRYSKLPLQLLSTRTYFIYFISIFLFCVQCWLSEDCRQTCWMGIIDKRLSTNIIPHSPHTIGLGSWSSRHYVNEVKLCMKYSSRGSLFRRSSLPSGHLLLLESLFRVHVSWVHSVGWLTWIHTHIRDSKAFVFTQFHCIMSGMKRHCKTCHRYMEKHGLNDRRL